MKQMFFNSNKGVEKSSLTSAVFSTTPASPVNDDWLFKKKKIMLRSVIGCRRKRIERNDRTRSCTIGKKPLHIPYLTTKSFEVNSLTSPGKRSPGSKWTMSPATISL